MAHLPNILVILGDDHGYGDISAHRGPHIQTPNIDRIAENGIRLTQFYANSSVCSPQSRSIDDRAVSGSGWCAWRDSHVSREQLGIFQS